MKPQCGLPIKTLLLALIVPLCLQFRSCGRTSRASLHASCQQFILSFQLIINVKVQSSNFKVKNLKGQCSRFKLQSQQIIKFKVQSSNFKVKFPTSQSYCTDDATVAFVPTVKCRDCRSSFLDELPTIRVKVPGSTPYFMAAS